MAWIIHHLDILEQYCFQYSRHIIIRCANATKVDKLSKKRAQILSAVYFSKKFNTLNFVIKESESILLFAHSRPDGDTTGSVLAMREYIKSLGKKVGLAEQIALKENGRNTSL